MIHLALLIVSAWVILWTALVLLGPLASIIPSRDREMRTAVIEARNAKLRATGRLGRLLVFLNAA
jgi:hypothetical protein